MKEEYPFCGGDWEYLTPHIDPYDWLGNIENRVLQIPFEQAGLESKRILAKFDSFLWFDSDSKLWWNFFPFLIETEDDKFQIDPAEKYSKFKWVSIDEIPKYSRLHYLEDVLENTIYLDKKKGE